MNMQHKENQEERRESVVYAEKYYTTQFNAMAAKNYFTLNALKIRCVKIVEKII